MCCRSCSSNGHKPEEELGAFIVGAVEVLEALDERPGALVNLQIKVLVLARDLFVQ